MHREGHALVIRAMLVLTCARLVQVQLLGQPISVGRPSGYVDPSTAQSAAAAAAAALAAFQVHTPRCMHRGSWAVSIVAC